MSNVALMHSSAVPSLPAGELPHRICCLNYRVPTLEPGKYTVKGTSSRGVRARRPRRVGRRNVPNRCDSPANLEKRVARWRRVRR